MAPKPVNKLIEGAAIDATGVIVEADVSYASDVGLHLTGTDTADYAVDVSPDGSTWFQGVDTFSATDDIDTVLTRPEAKLRVRVTSAAATGGATADVYVGANPT
jgi:hypothetical protein